MNSSHEVPWEDIARYVAGECSKCEAAEIRAWAASAESRAELLNSVQTVWRSSGEAPIEWDETEAWNRLRRRMADAEVVERADRAGTDPTRRSEKAASPARARLWGAGISLLAAAGLALVVFGPITPSNDSDFNFGSGEFVTGVSESATVVISDGSVVRLAPESRLRLLGASGSRQVYLEGQAYFAIAPMEAHPFQVRTKSGDAVVLGTRFEVRTRGEDLRLVVLEGRVGLSTDRRRTEVGAGEMTLISNGTMTAPVKVEDIRSLVGWLERFIVFQSTPMHEVARELEREYGVRVELHDSVLAGQTVTGWYADRSFEDVFAIVCGVVNARCSIQNGVARIES